MRDGQRIVEYITTFQTYSMLLKWNNKPLASKFCQGLAPRIKDDLAHIPNNRSFDFTYL